MPPRPRHADADSMLEHAAYLRRLARSLLRGEGHEDDVVQQAWIAALERPGGTIRAPRAWLAGAVRRLSWRRRRDEDRRRLREQRAAVPESGPEASAEHGALRVEALQRVLDAVTSLPAPYRDAILRRFFDDQSHAEIAAAHGVPEATARTWVHRGLKQLRARLDPEDDDARRAFLIALAPTAGLSPAALTITAAAGAAGGGAVGGLTNVGWWTMNAKTLFTALAVIAVGVSIWTWSSGRDGRSPTDAAGHRGSSAAEGPPATDAATGAADGGAADSSSADVRREVAGGDAPAHATSSWVVRGTCRDGEGVPAGDVPIHLRALPGLATWSSRALGAVPLEETTVRSDGEGRFAWPLDPPEGPVTLVAAAVQDEGWYSSDVIQYVRVGDDAPELGVEAYPLDGVLEGVVTDLRARPIADATVVACDQVATTDSDGRFSIRAPAGIGLRRIVAYAEGYAVRAVTLEYPARGETRSTELRLETENRVQGVVRDSDGRPIAGAEVYSSMNPTAKVLTDESGAYSLGHLEPGQWGHFVDARKAGYLQESVSIRDDPAGMTCDIVLVEGRAVNGRVVDEGGAPLHGARITAREEDGHDSFHAATDPNGRFELLVSPETLTLSTSFAGLAADDRALDASPAAELAPLEIVLSRGHFVGGRVTDERGVPVAGASLAFERGQNHRVGEIAQTDAVGRFRATGLPAGPLEVLISAPDHAYLHTSVRALDVEHHEWTLPRAGAIEGRVVDGRTGRPVTSFRLRMVDAGLADGEVGANFLSASWWDTGYDFEDADGRFTTRPHRIQVGAICALQVIAPGYAPGATGRLVASTTPELEPVEVRLFPPLLLRGRVVDSRTSEPIADASVRIHQESELLMVSGPSDAYPRVATDDAGRFELEVDAGEHRLRVDLPDGRIHLADPIVMPADGALAEQVLRVGDFGRIVGEVRDASGAGLPGESVTFRFFGLNTDTTKSTTTDTTGRFEFPDLTSGTYYVSHVVSVDGESLRATNHRARVRNGEVTTVILQPSGSATISGTVTSDGPPVPALLRIATAPTSGFDDSAAERLTSRAVFARDGHFRIDGLHPGTWEVEAYCWNEKTLWSGSASVELEDGAAKTVTLELRPEEQ